MNFFSKKNFAALIISSILLTTVLFSEPIFAQQQYQYPTLSVTPSNVTVNAPATTVNVAISSITGLNAIHFVLRFNDQGATFLSAANADIVIGNLFAGLTPTLVCKHLLP